MNKTIEEKVVVMLDDTVELYQDDKIELIKKLSNLVQKEREEAINQYVDSSKFIYLVESGEAYVWENRTNEAIYLIARENLSQTKGGKE